MMCSRIAAALLICGATLFSGASAHASVLQAPGGTSTPTKGASDLSARVQASSRAALDWLAAQQDADGSWSPSGVEAVSSGLDAAGHAPVAVASIAALAFMAGGSTPDRGPHGAHLAKTIDWLVAHCELQPGSPRYGWISRPGDLVSRMHGHGLATLALAQAWSMSKKCERGARIERALRAAVDLLTQTQGVEGGWWYEPVRAAQHESSLTICAVQALRGARDAGIAVDAKVIDRALSYVRRTRREDGAFLYAIGDKQASVALTAASIATLQSAGAYSSAEVRAGHDWLTRALALRGTPDAPEAATLVVCPHYERLYLSQALWQLEDGHAHAAWRERDLPRLLAQQERDGRFRDRRFGDVYATAMEVLVVLVADGVLPVFQR